jgi:PKD repeat protein
VKDIINRDLSASSEYYWDFDGDGFYEQKGTTPTISHKYTASGTFFPKLKVRHK